MTNFIRVNVIEFILDGTGITGNGIAENFKKFLESKVLINEFSFSAERCNFTDDFFKTIKDSFCGLKQIMVLAFDFLET